MTYTTNMPTANQSLGQTQQLVQDNFNIIQRGFSADIPASTGDHGSLSSSLEGKHLQMHMPEIITVSGIPVPTTAVNEIALYCQHIGAISALYMRQPSNGTQIQLSNVDPIIAQNGYTFLPGGLMLNFGFSPIGGLATGSINFAKPFINNCFVVLPTLQVVGSTGQSNTISVKDTPTLLKFDWNFTGTTSYDNIYWIAIGN